MMSKILIALFATVHTISAQNQGCPNTAPLPRSSCAGKVSTCWSPGVRDTDCPANGLCCFDGCVNLCVGSVPFPPPIVPVRSNLIPIVPPYSPIHILVKRTTRAPVNPCQPTPCGPNTICTVNNVGNAICNCVPGMIPKPDTITGCGPECVRDPDCQYGEVCLNQRCVEKPDPCDPSPCGPGAVCMTNNIGNAICRCEPGLIPKPDTITGCGPECVIDPDCSSGYVCENQRCIEKPDPCNPSPCGPGAVCTTNGYGNAICSCMPGLLPMPDSIKGCGPECLRDSDCHYDLICDYRIQRCIEKPNPCIPTRMVPRGPCGPGTTCMVNSDNNAVCRCEPGLIPKPDTITGCGPECIVDPDCPGDYVCEQQKCIERPDPCDPSPCGPGAICTVGPSGNPICRCEPGLIPNPDTITGCKPECVIDPDCGARDYICENQKCVLKPDPCDPSPCGPGTMCMSNKLGNPICRCLAGLIPKPDTITGCGPECTIDPDCSTGYICDNQKCVEEPDPCNPTPCGAGAISTPEGPPGAKTCACTCPAGSFGDPRQKCTQGECQRDEECADTEACEDYYCVNVCKAETCQKDLFCKAIRHVPVCGRNYVPEPQEPRDIFVIGESYKNPKEQPTSRGSAPSNTFVIGSRHGDGGAGGQSSWKGRSPSSKASPRSNSAVIGSRYRRRRHLAPIFFDF